MDKRLETIKEMYAKVFTVAPLKKSGAFTLLTSDKVSCGVFNTEEDAIAAMPVIWFNSSRGYVPKNVLNKRPNYGRVQAVRK